MDKNFSKRHRAYSLIELSIVLVVISVLVSGALMVSTENLKREQVSDTKERMNKIYSALARYIMLERSFPCPARISAIKSVDADYGLAATSSGVCTGVIINGDTVWGAVPSQLLGLPFEMSEDAFGSKIIYFVDRRFTSSASLSSNPNFSGNNFSTMANNQLSTSPLTLWTIQQRVGTSLQTITSNAVFGLVSLGPNKNGAFNANSNVKNTPPALIDDDETTNHNPSNIIIASSSNGGTFDDIVFYKTFRNLISDNPDFKNLVPCRNSDLASVAMNNGVSYNSTYFDTSGVTNNAWFDGVTYSKQLGLGICPQNSTLRYSFRCSEGGKWVPIVNSCQSAVGGCTVSANTNYGSGSVYNGPSISLTSGGSVAMECRPGFGRVIDGVTKSSNNSGQTCGNASTDRSNTLIPTVLCASGSIQVINDCSACRGCNASSPFNLVYHNNNRNVFSNTFSCTGHTTGGQIGHCYYLRTDDNQDACYNQYYTPITRPTIPSMNNGKIIYYCNQVGDNADSTGAFGLRCADGIIDVRIACDDGQKCSPRNTWTITEDNFPASGNNMIETRF